jgi:hypothetical protein
LAPGSELPGRNSGMAVASEPRLRRKRWREALGDTRSSAEQESPFSVS